MEDMNWKKYIKKALCLAFEPIRRNANFFTFMYILGVLTAVVTLPRWGELYDNLYLELFFDLYIVCAVRLSSGVALLQTFARRQSTAA